MRPFNLQKALESKPVKLRNGYKGYLALDTRKLNEDGDLDYTHPVLGVFITNGKYYFAHWDENGKFWNDQDKEFDIVGMWDTDESSKPTTSKTNKSILDEALNKGSPVYCDKYPGVTYLVIAKSSLRYILKNTETGTLTEQTIAGLENNLVTYSLDDLENLTEKRNMTVTLPRGFSPSRGEDYWFINNKSIGKLEIVQGIKSEFTPERRNCFRTKQQAQDWLDAIYSAFNS